ncbi:cyclic nucleotide-binding domain-containing protein 1 [Latimeria chalumnae]|uniref:Cyclic nucleotide binding domain containing 1 n=1 Tax=Latimeria chalumnae TaxID=7897 RepID=M3XKB8_LATCH|nr:PREDICTED: cyclic nucleotide-binding domain-containing protein 1 [Latimeria chalumnae]|eukprot:XP_014347385.1 PREDICTED: cyclic nucleotide-binding domain-containing protein 1 [Latimeria chalumnae]
MSASAVKQEVLSSFSHDETQKQSFLKIDYAVLDALRNINGLQQKDSTHSTDEAHDIFMNLYPKMFIQKKPILPGIPTEKSERKSQKEFASGSSWTQIHHGSLQKGRKDVKITHAFSKLLHTVIMTLKKFPANRSLSETEKVYKLMKNIPDITCQLSDKEIKELSRSVTLESWEKGYTVFGNQGFYVILQGCVKPQTLPYKKFLDESVEFKSPTPPLLSCSSIAQVLGISSCFGTLIKVPDRNLNSKILSVYTEDYCEFLKISTSDYLRVKQIVLSSEEAKKKELIQTSALYHSWPKLSIENLASVMEWKHIPTGQVIVKEGDISPFVGFIKSGCCNLLRDIEALVQLPLRRMVKRVRRVMMGKLFKKESFGEFSILMNIPFTCTIVTATDVELGILRPSVLQDLPPVIQTLMLQTAHPTLGKFTQEEISNKYVLQEKQKQWQNFKHKVMEEVLSRNEIRPDSGKWNHLLHRRGAHSTGASSKSLLQSCSIIRVLK